NVCPGIDAFPMELKEGRYRLSFWVKADRDDGGANFGLYGYDKSPWKDITANRDWHQETLDFEVPRDTQRTCWRITATRRGTLWVDALEVRPLP
ncbi:MAG: hypothetical protein HZB16_08565, partial [Armatimonadetes bacterium]|nr:hypothetical protein [Armatimonadota bacterium]